jgi:hypothetical protein
VTDSNSPCHGLTRRSVLRILTAIGAAAALPSAPARAAEAPHLDVKDPAATALGYVENVAQVDLKKYPDYAKGSNCENCLQLQGSAGNNYRPCSLFPGKLVSVSGWCKGWTPEM